MKLGRMILTLGLVAALSGLTLVGGCQKEEEDQGKVDLSAVEPLTPPKQSAGFIEEQPLTSSPFSLGGQKLGQGLGELQADLVEQGREFQTNMHDTTQTGTLASAPNEAAPPGSPRQEIAFFEAGRLVGFQQLIDMDRAAFDAKVADYTALYGAPTDTLPEYVSHSDLYIDATETSPAELLVWVDEPTRTVLLGSLSAEEQHSMWVVYHPEGQAAARFEALGALGS